MIEIAKLKKDVEYFKSKEKNDTEIMRNFQNNIKDMAINITALNEKTKALEDIKGEVKEIKAEVKGINAEVNGINAEVKGINAEVKEMKKVISQERCREFQVLRNDIKEEFARSRQKRSLNEKPWVLCKLTLHELIDDKITLWMHACMYMCYQFINNYCLQLLGWL